MALLVPLAHTGHWLWVLYLPPVLIVAGSIIRTKLLDRRSGRNENSSVGDSDEERLTQLAGGGADLGDHPEEAAKPPPQRVVEPNP